MKYVLFTFSGEGLPVMQKLAEEGHDITIARIEDVNDIYTDQERKNPKPETREERKRRYSLYEGLLKMYPAAKVLNALKKVSNPEEYFILFDMNNGFRFAEQLVGLGFHGLFPTKRDREFEIDREKAKEFVRANYPDVLVAPVQTFATIEEAKMFLAETEEIWVLKGKSEDCRTVVPDVEDPMLAANQIIEALEENPKAYEGNGFILELKIQDPIELTPQKVYYDGKPIFTDLDIELKTLGSGDLGQMTGCAADLVFKTPMNCRLNQIAFPKIVDDLAKQHTRMFVWDISLLIDRKTGKVYMGEFCPNRLGWNAFYTELCQLDSVSDFFEAIVKGYDPYEYSIGKFGASVRLFNLPDKPAYLEQGQDLRNQPIAYREEIMDYLWLMDAMRKGDKVLTTGYSWDLAVMTGHGDSIYDAVERAYDAIKGFSFPELYYRPKHDYLSMDYPTSIMNRYNYVLFNGLIQDLDEHQPEPMPAMASEIKST